MVLSSARSHTKLTSASFFLDLLHRHQEVSASLQNGDLILTLTFPAEQTMNQLKLNFIAGRNSEGAALCIDGFMNMRPEASWTAFLYSMTRDGTRDGPYCQWSLNYGEFEVDMTRVQKVEQLLKVMENH